MYVFQRIISYVAVSVLLAGAVGSVKAADPAAPPLTPLNIDNTRIGIAGFSSGAYMAIQMQLSYPEIFKRAGIVAGGPYACAEDLDAVSDTTRLYKCMQGQEASEYIIPAKLKEWALRASQRAAGGLASLDDGTAFFLHGTNDKTVEQFVARDAVSQYGQLRVNGEGTRLVRIKITDDDRRSFAHTFPTQSEGGECNKSVFPYISRCGFDGAEAVVKMLFGPPYEVQPSTPGGVEKFDQTTLRPEGSVIADYGYAYIPQACKAGQKCGVLLMLHGCSQTAQAVNPDPTQGEQGVPVGDRFAKQTGFNKWADPYSLIVVYPQVQVSKNPDNINGCWDWWGYTGKEFDLRTGKQALFLINTLKALGYKS